VLDCRRLAENRVFDRVAVRVAQSRLDQADRKVCDVDPDPTATEPLRRRDGCSAPTERIEHDVALVRARKNDSLKQGLRFLRRIAETLGGSVADSRDISPDRSDLLSLSLVEIHLEAV